MSGSLPIILASALKVSHAMIPGIQSAINGLLGMNLVASWYEFKPMQQQ